MTERNRRKRHAQDHADRQAERVGLRGWIIVRPGGTWFGPYPDRATARRKIGRLDSLEMKISGEIVFAGPKTTNQQHGSN